MPIPVTRTSNPKPRVAESELGFGRYFSDHQLVMEWTDSRGWQQARIEPNQPIAMDPAACVLHYGQALFEGMKVFRGDDGVVRIFRVDAHCRRMAKGAGRLCLPSIEANVLAEALLEFVDVERDWIPSSAGTALYLRPTMVATESFLGVRPANEVRFFTIASPVGAYYGGSALRAVRIWVETEQTRAAPGGLGAIKAAANYAASLQAAVKAKALGFDQVLWLDSQTHGFVEEVGTMNFCAVLNGEVVTPPLSDTILAGITRDSVLTLAHSLGLRAIERPIAIDELRHAHRQGQLTELFGTGTAAVISPIGELAIGHDEVLRLGEPGPVAKAFYEAITNIQRGNAADPHDWMTVVKPRQTRASASPRDRARAIA